VDNLLISQGQLYYIRFIFRPAYTAFNQRNFTRFQMKNFLRNNGLSIVFLAFFLIALCGQVFTGLKQYNQEMEDMGGKQVSLSGYFASGHFFESTF